MKSDEYAFKSGFWAGVIAAIITMAMLLDWICK